MDENKPDLRTAYRMLDPAKPLEGWSLSNYYAQRPGAPIAKLAEEIKERSQPFRAIMAGQRGVGKTTELNLLKGELERAGQCVFQFDLGRVAGTNAATALAFVTQELVASATDVDFGKLLQIKKWITRDFTNRGTFFEPHELPEVAQVAKGVIETIQRKKVSERDLRDEHGQRMDVTEANRRWGGLEPILLLDGWERVASNAEVYPFMDALEGINCSTVLVTRLSAILESGFNRFTPDWDLTLLPAVPLFTYERQSDADGWSLLLTALEKRAAKQAFSTSALNVIIQASGGMFRDLISLGRHACLLAERAGKDQADLPEADAALREHRLKHTATLTREDREMLSTFARQDRSWADQSVFEQVNQGRIIAYHREKLWFDVHPILWPLVGVDYPPPPSMD